MEYVMAILTTLLGGALALMGVIISNRSNQKAAEVQISQTRKVESENRFREAGEELFVLFSRWSTYFVSSGMPLVSVMQGKISYDDYLDTVIDGGKKNSINLHQIEFLIQAYFPSLAGRYTQVLAERGKHNKIIAEHKRAYLNGQDGAPFVEDFVKAQIMFENCAEELKASIISETKRYV